jgi:hypothetical protein
MSDDRFGTLAVIYILLSLTCVAMVMGSVSRGAMSFWVWEAIHAHSHDTYAELFLDIAITRTFYGIVYSAFFIYPYAALRLMYPTDNEGLGAIVALWVAVTIAMFHREFLAAITGFATALEGGGTLWQWLTILWPVFTLFAVLAWRRMIEAKYKAKYQP